MAKKTNLKRLISRYQKAGCRVEQYEVKESTKTHTHTDDHTGDCQCCLGICDCRIDDHEVDAVLLIAKKDGQIVAEEIVMPE